MQYHYTVTPPVCQALFTRNPVANPRFAKNLAIPPVLCYNYSADGKETHRRNIIFVDKQWSFCRRLIDFYIGMMSDPKNDALRT